MDSICFDIRAFLERALSNLPISFVEPLELAFVPSSGVGVVHAFPALVSNEVSITPTVPRVYPTRKAVFRLHTNQYATCGTPDASTLSALARIVQVRATTVSVAERGQQRPLSTEPLAFTCEVALEKHCVLIVVDVPVGSPLGTRVAIDLVSVGGGEVELHSPAVSSTVEVSHAVAKPGPVYAAAISGNLEALEKAFETGSTQERDGADWTALHYAARFGFEQVVEALLAVGADVNALAQHKITPLHGAVESGHAYVVRLLLDAGADVHATDAYGKSPTSLALHPRKNEEIYRLLQQSATAGGSK